MKTDFSINVQVNIGVTPEVVQLVTAILQRTPTVAVPATSEQPAPEAPAPTGKRGKGKAKTETPAPESAPAEQPAEEKPAGDAGQAEPEAAPEAEPEAKELTEQDVREAMHRARQRIEGEDYKDNAQGEGYTKYHRQLTATFKNISALLGSDKPSTLPADKREAFIKECDELQILEDGTIGTKAPF